MKLFKTSILVTFVTFLLLVLLETIFYFGRIYLNKPNVGFLINFNKSVTTRIKDNCQRMKTHPILNYIHFHNSKCKVFGSSKYDEYFIWYKKNEISKNKKKLLILTSGGSTTDGFYQHISNGYTWPYYLQKICEKEFNCQVINGGTGGYSTTQELLKLITYNHLVPKIDYVISLNGINDIRTSRRTSGKNFKLHPYLTKVQYEMLQEQIWVNQHKENIKIFPNILSFVNYTKFHNKNFNKLDLFDKKKNNKKEKDKLIMDLNNYSIVWQKNINLMYGVSNSINSIFFSFLQPTMGLDYVNFNKNLSTKDVEMYENYKNTKLNLETNAFYKILRNKCQQIEFCIDISHTAAPGENLFNDPRHHNSKGNLVIAKEIFDKIKKNEELKN